MLESLTKFAAVAGSIVAVGQTATTTIEGYFKSKSEEEITKREKDLADIKERSELAQSYLQLILNKDTPIESRVILYSALGEIEGHPLQKWAQKQNDKIVQYNTQLEKALNDEGEAVQHAQEAGGNVKVLETEIVTLNLQISQNVGIPEKVKELQSQLIAKSSELAKARADLSLSDAKLADIKANKVRSSSADPALVVTTTSSLASEISTISQKINANFLKTIFPVQASKNIDSNVQYLQAALQEFKIFEPRMVAAIVATIAVESPNFDASYEEPDELAKRNEGRRELGNTQSGDGIRYRGRGYIGLTGRENYQKMSERLGLGTRLADSPEDANSPEVASRILVAWFSDRQEKLLSIKDENNFMNMARKIVAGGPRNLEEFTSVFQKVMKKLADT